MCDYDYDEYYGLDSYDDEDNDYCYDCECYYNDPKDDCDCCCHQDTFDKDDVDYDPEYKIDGVGFADPGGRSALRAETRDNPRDCSCPNCGRENILTRIDRARGYQCDRCADAAECGW